MGGPPCCGHEVAREAMRVSPSPTPGACPPGRGDRGEGCGLIMRGTSHRWPAGYRAVPGPTHMSVLASKTRAGRYRWGRFRRRRVVVALLVGLFLAAGAVAGIVREVGGSEADHPAVKAGEARSSSDALEGTLDVLVLGVDRRPSAAEGSTSHSDTMMLVRVSPRTGDIRLLSVPRDLLVEVKPGVEDRINTAYLYGGTQRATEVMENLTGITVTATPSWISAASRTGSTPWEGSH